MGRKEARLAAALEQNPAREFNRIRDRFLPHLMDWFSETADPRNQSYTTYSNTEMLAQMFYKGVAGIETMRGMTQAFNTKAAAGNISLSAGGYVREYLPHHVTENDYLKKLSPEELRGVLHKMAYSLIRRKTFGGAKFRGRWLVAVDGTQTYSGSRRINDGCLERHYSKGTEEESVNYHCDVLEAKIYFGDGLMLSVGSEFMENDRGAEDGGRQKQDCERKAFRRLAGKLKGMFPRLPVVLLMDSLYAAEPVMEVCRENGWDYIIRFKDGSIPGIAEEYGAIPEKGRCGRAEFVNGIDYNGHGVNMLRFHETKMEGGREKRTDFQWLTDIRITEGNAERLASAGRLRWKIENFGFNRQKNWSGDITHACCWDSNALKNHYLMQQIADFARQLYEWFFLHQNGIVKAHKKISSDLLFALTKQLIETEDMAYAEALPAFC